MDDVEFDVSVIGAGIAGLSAALALADAGKRVGLIEARDRVGGRIYSRRVDNCKLPVELGAEFVHGRPNELFRLISEAAATPFELDGDDLCFRAGQLERCRRDGALSVLEELPTDPDLAFADWIAAKKLPPEKVQPVISYVEGFNAADAHIVGTASLAQQQKAEDAIEGDELYRLEEGYTSIVEYLLRRFMEKGGEIFLSTVVKAIRWRIGDVRVEATRDAERSCFRSRQCVVAIPLGVLQAGDVRFDPYPPKIFQAVNMSAMGQARRIGFLFRDCFWARRYPNASFIFAEGDVPSTWWTAAPKSVPMLTGWVGGPRAYKLLPTGAEDFARASMSVLAKVFGMPLEEVERQVLRWDTHDWRSDPFSRGAYSYLPKGALRAPELFGEPVENTLFLAGEHTDERGHWGTVHGALYSGLRAARQLCSTSLR